MPSLQFKAFVCPRNLTAVHMTCSMHRIAWNQQNDSLHVLIHLHNSVSIQTHCSHCISQPITVLGYGLDHNRWTSVPSKAKDSITWTVLYIQITRTYQGRCRTPYTGGCKYFLHVLSSNLNQSLWEFYIIESKTGVAYQMSWNWNSGLIWSYNADHVQKGIPGMHLISLKSTSNCLHDLYFYRTLNYNILPCCISSTVHKYIQIHAVLLHAVFYFGLFSRRNSSTWQVPASFHNFRSQLRFPMNLQLLKVHE